MASSSVGIVDLPNEVLCEIFSKLSPEDVLRHVITVCKHWNAVVKENRSFWDHLQMTVHCDMFFNSSFFDEESAENQIGLIIGEKDVEKFSSLRHLKMIEGSKAKCQPALLVIRILDIISKTCKNIEKVEFVRCFGATSKYFIQFLREQYNNIKEIRFGMNCTSIIPYYEISKFTNITTLVSHDYALKKSDLYVLADGCQTLSSLWILHARSPRVCDMLYFLEKKKNVLKELGLGMKMQDCILAKLKECLCLEVLFVADARDVTDVCVRAFSNLPRLRYCSFHGAKFQLDTVWNMIKAGSSGISKDLIILDMTGYEHRNEFIKSIHTKRECIDMWKDSKFITFKNNVNVAIYTKWYTKSPFHWMYRGDNIFQEIKCWRRKEIPWPIS